MKLKQLLTPKISRRSFVKGGSILGGITAITSGIALPFASRSASAAPQPATAEDKVVWSACTVNCGSRCPLRMHVSNGEIKWVETDNTGDDEYGNHQVRACLRGRSMRRRVIILTV